MPSESEGGLLPRLALLLRSRAVRITVCAFALAAPAFGVVCAPKFLALLQLNVSPPASTAAYRALAAYQRAFPRQAAATPDSFVLIVTRGGGRPVLNSSDPQCHMLSAGCPLVAPLASFSAGLESWLNDTLPPGWVNDSTVGSYHRFHREQYTLLQTALLSEPHRPAASNATLMRVQVPMANAKGFAFTKALAAQVRALVAREGGEPVLSVAIAGMPAFLEAAQDGVKADIEKMDTYSLPLALLIFVIMLRSARLLLLPILNIAVVVSASFTLMYPIAQHLDVGSTVPSLMLSAASASTCPPQRLLTRVLRTAHAQPLRACPPLAKVVIVCAPLASQSPRPLTTRSSSCRAFEKRSSVGARLRVPSR